MLSLYQLNPLDCVSQSSKYNWLTSISSIPQLLNPSFWTDKLPTPLLSVHLQVIYFTRPHLINKAISEALFSYQKLLISGNGSVSRWFSGGWTGQVKTPNDTGMAPLRGNSDAVTGRNLMRGGRRRSIACDISFSNLTEIISLGCIYVLMLWNISIIYIVVCK